LLGISKTDRDLETTHYDAAEYDPALLSPDGTGVFIEYVGDETTKWSEDEVHETKHGCPAAGTGLSELREILEIVCAEDRVDCKFTTCVSLV
jgi:hypothetical protein